MCGSDSLLHVGQAGTSSKSPASDLLPTAGLSSKRVLKFSFAFQPSLSLFKFELDLVDRVLEPVFQRVEIQGEEGLIENGANFAGCKCRWRCR